MTMHQGYLPMTFVLPLLMLASALTCRACAAGRITRNHWLPATGCLRSSSPRRPGARATPLLGPVFLLVGLPAFVLALVWAMIRAVRAAKHAPAPPRPGRRGFPLPLLACRIRA